MFNIREWVSPVLAITVTLGGLLILWFKPEVKTETIGLMTLVLTFYFGSSKGSEDKNKTIAEMGERKDA